MLKMMNYLFTSESVSEGHPDKVADQIADSILDEFLRRDLESKVACEVFCSTGLVIIGGEVSSDAYVDVQSIARETILRIGYDKASYLFDGNSCGVLSEIHEQSPDIRRGLTRQNPEDQGAGDQGMMFGYACRETEDYMPLPIYLSHLTLRVLADIRRDESRRMPYLRPDAKSQFTIEYDNARRPVRAPYDRALHPTRRIRGRRAMHARIEQDVRDILIPQVIAGFIPKPQPCSGMISNSSSIRPENS